MSLDIPGLVSMGLGLAFNLAETIVRAGYYVRVAPGTYDPATGTMTPTETRVAVDFIATTYSEQEVAGLQGRSNAVDMQLGDERVVIDRRVLVAGGVTDLDVDDILEETGGPTRQIIGYTLEPTGQALTLHCRRLGS